MGIDATRTWPDEGHTREWPDELAMDPAVEGAGRRALGRARPAVLVSRETLVELRPVPASHCRSGGPMAQPALAPEPASGRPCSPASSRSSTASSRCPSPTRARFWRERGSPRGSTLIWITVAMVAARSAAMALNRLIDAEHRRAQPAYGGARAAGRAPVARRGRGSSPRRRSACSCSPPSTCRRPAATCGRSSSRPSWSIPTRSASPGSATTLWV